MKILICYTSYGLSNSIASSTMEKLKQNPIENADIERINVTKRSIKKYIELNGTPDVVYIYKGVFKYEDMSNIGEYLETENIPFETYDQTYMHKPNRVPGNKLKTRVYLLYDKVKLDIETNFKKITLYKIKTKDHTIAQKEVSISILDIPYVSNETSGWFKTKSEAIDELIREKENQSNDYDRYIQIKEAEIRTLEDQKTEVVETIKNLKILKEEI